MLLTFAVSWAMDRKQDIGLDPQHKRIGVRCAPGTEWGGIKPSEVPSTLHIYAVCSLSLFLGGKMIQAMFSYTLC